MAWYSSGTVTVTNGSATITGSGTAFVSNVRIGEAFRGPNGAIHEITAVNSDTQLTISPVYSGSTAGGQGYAIIPVRGIVPTLISGIGNLINDYGDVVTGIGAGLFPDGNAAAPAFRFANDQDTGIYRFEPNGVGFATAGVFRGGFSGNGRFSVAKSDPQAPVEIYNVGPSSGLNEILRLSNGFVASAENRPAIRFDNSLGTSWWAIAAQVALDKNFRIYDDNNIRFVINVAGQVTPGVDNSQSLGNGGFRWTTVFAATGSINTSDEREKHWRGELNAAELRAAKRIIAELGIYQWNDAVAEKGETGARLHFGVRAQRAFEIMEDEGLDWGRYAWCCYDQWEAKTESLMGPDGKPTGETRTTPAGDRYGVRPDQLAFWLIAAQAAMQADLEARIAALEAA